MILSRRKAATATVAWLFGLAATVLLISLWGRAVVVDTDRLSHSLSPLAESDLVADRVAGWLVEELGEGGLDAGQAGTVGGQAARHPAVRPALEELVAGFLAAAADDSPGGGVVEVADLLLPHSEDIAVALADAGVPATVEQVTAVVAGLDPLVVRRPDQPPTIGPSSPLATNLGTAALLALVVMGVTASLYVRLETDRVRALRSLFHRFGLGALSFAIILRIGGWATDPGGGRAPVGETVSRLAHSQAMLPLLLGVGSLAAASALWVVRRRFRREEGSRWRAGRPRPEPAERR